VLWNTKKVYSNRKTRHFQILVSVEVFSVLLLSGFLFDKFSPFEEKLLEGLKTGYQTSTEQEQVIPAKTFIPHLIVRTVAGSKSLFFFMGLDADVLFVKHDTYMLYRITDENTTILWEPGSSPNHCYSVS